MEISKEVFLMRLSRYFQKEERSQKNEEYTRACREAEAGLLHLSVCQHKYGTKDEKVHIGKTFGVFGFDIE